MHIAVLSTDEQWDVLQNNNSTITLTRVTNFTETNANAYFSLQENANTLHYQHISKPIFIHSVLNTLTEINAAPNVIRINAWQGFLQRPVWEVAGKFDDAALQIIKALQKKAIVVADEVGLVSPKIIAMIINEAYFALGEKVSTKEEIDIAMKLGTNYPYGPFEWANKIGIKNIFELLNKLSQSDSRYLPAPFLKQEAILLCL